MRWRLVVAASLACIALAPAASATLLPPAPSRPFAGLKVLALPKPVPVRIGRTCMIRTKLARRLAPVACEQPPRSEVLLAALTAF